MATHPLPDRFLRIRAVLDRTGLSRATLYRKINAATFPPQQKLSERCSGWRESHVNIWLRNPTTFTVADLADEPECKHCAAEAAQGGSSPQSAGFQMSASPP